VDHGWFVEKEKRTGVKEKGLLQNPNTSSFARVTPLPGELRSNHPALVTTGLARGTFSRQLQFKQHFSTSPLLHGAVLVGFFVPSSFSEVASPSRPFRLLHFFGVFYRCSTHEKLEKRFHCARVPCPDQRPLAFSIKIKLEEVVGGDEFASSQGGCPLVLALVCLLVIVTASMEVGLLSAYLAQE